jgi:hypothetical protein
MLLAASASSAGTALPRPGAEALPAQSPLDGPLPDAVATSLRLAQRIQQVGPDASAIAAAASSWQAAHLGTTVPAGAPAVRFEAPSQAARALAERHGVADPAGAALALDGLQEPARQALTDLLASFIAFEDATAAAFAAAPGAKADLGPVLAARGRFLDDALAFTAAWQRSAAVGPDVDLCPALAVDLLGADTTYTENCAFILDVDGDDVYLNNAGGNHLIGAIAECSFEGGAGALIDVLGNDQYVSGGNCGVNGGAYTGAGFLLDQSGNDLYRPGSYGVNGGAQTEGLGFLLDQGGDDVYAGGEQGVNGGAYGGAGILLDIGGNDAYSGSDNGVNGAGYFAGLGFLADVDGADTYTAGSQGTNGGGRLGTGFLLDVRGDDAYTAGEGGTNGGGALGAGFLMDANGHDTYVAEGGATNGGGSLGTGFLLDLVGDDSYTATDSATNGGGFQGSGFLIDLFGNDSYRAGSYGVNGGASLTGTGLLFDGQGTDQYWDDEGGSGTDRTLLLKEGYGAQVDV